MVVVVGVVTLCSSLFLSQVEAPVPAPTPAPAPPPPARVTEAPRWSVGAGFGIFESLGLSALPALGGSGSLSGVVSITPTPRLTAERLFGDHFALGLGLVATFQAGDTNAMTNASIGATLGPRWILTNPDAVVAVSAWVAAVASYGVLEFPATFALRSTSFGGLAGVALERTLLERLSIRLHLQLARVTWSRSVLEQTGTPLIDPAPAATRAEVTQASFLPSPSLELRFYF